VARSLGAGSGAGAVGLEAWARDPWAVARIDERANPKVSAIADVDHGALKDVLSTIVENISTTSLADRKLTQLPLWEAGRPSPVFLLGYEVTERGEARRRGRSPGIVVDFRQHDSPLIGCGGGDASPLCYVRAPSIRI
jgi:hypothetical protein